MIVTVRQDDPKPYTFEELEGFEKDAMFAGEKLMSSQRTTFNGMEAFRMEIEGTQPDGPIKYKTVTIFFKNNGLIYRINYDFETSKQEQYQPIFDKMLDTFKVK